MKKIIAPLGKIMEWGIFAVIFAVFLAVISPLLPTKNKFRTYIVSSGSMEPAVKAGSLALIKGVPVESIKENDVIAFSLPDDQKKEILHRVEAVVKENGEISFQTRGDNNDSADNWLVPSFSVKGVMLTAIPYIGHPAAMMRTPRGFALLMGLPAVFLVFLFIRQVIDGIDEEIKRRVQRRAVIFILAALIPFNLVVAGSKTLTALFNSTATVSGITLTVKDCNNPELEANLSGDNHTVSFTLNNLFGCTSYQYNLTYDTDGPPQGVNGTVTLAGEGESSRDFYLGTCTSGGTCTPHTGISNLLLKVDVYKGATVYLLEKDF